MANRILEIEQRLHRKYRARDSVAVASSLSRRTRALSDRSFDLRFDVPLIPQQTGMSCWAAAAAMIVAWREQLTADPATIAKAAGEWVAYSAGLHPESTSIFPVWGLTPEPQQSYTPEGLFRVLDTYGPLWVAGAVPGPHVRVVTGMYGNGTVEGTRVLINDPWQKGMTAFSLPNAGARYEQTYREFVADTERLARQELPAMPNAIYVARSTRQRLVGAQSRRSNGFARASSTRLTYPLAPGLHARSFTVPVDFQVPRPVPPTASPSANTAWAAATAMLASYKAGKPVSVDEAVRQAGGRFEQLLRGNATLPQFDMADYLTALGLVAEPLSELNVDKVHQLLRRYGAIWLTPDYPGVFSLDARIVTGIRGDGTASGTQLLLIEPGSGATTAVPLDRLGSAFKQEDRARPAPGMIAIYWPTDTLAESRPAADRPAGVERMDGAASPAGQVIAASIGAAPWVRAFVAPLTIAELGLAVFSTAQPIFSSGALKFQSAPASYVHPNTPLDTPFQRFTTEFNIIADHPRLGFSNQQFWFRLGFDFNGYDVRDATIAVLEDKSSKMLASDFEVNFVPTAFSAQSDPVAVILYRINGRWDPIGRGSWTFDGSLRITADGKVQLSIDGEDNWVTHGGFAKQNITRLPTPSRITPFWEVHFSPAGSAKLDDAAIKDIKKWYENLLPDVRSRVRDGSIPITLHGYASTTSSVAKNQELARKRIEAVKTVLRDFAGSDAKFVEFAHGELNAGTADNVEDPGERRVRMEVSYFKQL